MVFSALSKRRRTAGRAGKWGLAVGLLLLILFAVPQVAQAQTSLPGDIVFIIDESGSMEDEINAVRANVNSIAAQLESASIDPRFALVEFGGREVPNPGLTTDLTDADGLSSALATLFPNNLGSFEPGIDATILAANEVSFRPGAGVCYVLVTDEDSDGGNLATAVGLLQAQTATWFGIVNPTFGSTEVQYGPNPGSLSEATGGAVFSIQGFATNPQPVLDALLDGCIGSILEGINLTPQTATNPVDTSHTVTAIVSDSTGARLPGVTVDFEVTSGPNAGTSGSGVTDANGEATFTYTGSGGPGTDSISGSFTDSSGTVQTDTAEKIWEEVEPPSGTCDEVVISDYSGTADTVEVTNAASIPIELGTCSLVGYDAFAETATGGVLLTGSLAPGESATYTVPGMPDGPGAVGVYDGPPPAVGSPFTTMGDITGMVYLSDSMVYGVAHLRVPAHNAVYDCIYGGSGTGPFMGRNPVGSCLTN